MQFLGNAVHPLPALLLAVLLLDSHQNLEFPHRSFAEKTLDSMHDCIENSK